MYIKEFKNGDSQEIGLKNDDYEKQKNLMLDKQLITSPHDYDEFLFNIDSEIMLKAKTAVSWKINDTAIGHGKELIYKITSPGTYTINAQNKTDNQTEQIKIFINERKD